MSYTMDIVSGRVPGSYEEALDIRNGIIQARDRHLGTGPDSGFEEPSSEMQALHDRFTSRYPCITVDPEGPWSDGPLINNFGQQAATVGISYSHVNEVLPFVISTSNAMGFWVFDAQDETVHLPSGVTLRPSHTSKPRQRRWWQLWKS